MSSSKVFSQRSLIAVFAVAVAVVMWPAPASAQYPEGCGWCHTNLQDGDEYHWFGGLLIADRCDNAGGCHSWGEWGACEEYHRKCFLRPVWTIESAIIQRNSSDFAHVLASSENWVYEPKGRAVSFTCSGYTVARCVLPEHLAKVADPIWRAKELPDRTEEEREGLAGRGL